MFNDDYEFERETVFEDGEEWITVETAAATLHRRREQLGLTQLQVATAAGINLRQYQRLESGERTISGTSLRIGLAVCRALRLDPYRFAV